MQAETQEILEKIQAQLVEDHDIEVPLEQLATTEWRATGLDSLPLMQTVMHLEWHYGITITNEALRAVRTFEHLATVIQDAMGG